MGDSMGLELIKPGTHIDFLKYRKIAYVFSAAIILAGFLSLAVKGGPRYGVDFAGGLTIQLKFDKPVDVADIRKGLEPVGLQGMAVQRFGQDSDGEYLVRATEQDMSQEGIREAVTTALAKALPDSGFSVQRLEMVGPKVGADLRSKAIEAVFYAVLLIAIYISGRFEQRWMAAGIMAAGLTGGVYLLNLLHVPTGYLILAAMCITILLCWYMRLKFALGAVVADLHDVFVTIGIFSLLDKEFDLTTVAALLTILGYSLNDTIIVFDRIRETMRSADKKEPLADIINRSINQTLTRTILTAGTTLVVTLCLYLFGGGVIHDFALALLIGILAGTYSSIFIASPILLDLGSGFVRKEQAPEATEPAA